MSSTRHTKTNANLKQDVKLQTIAFVRVVLCLALRRNVFFAILHVLPATLTFLKIASVASRDIFFHYNHNNVLPALRAA